ncbi:MFS transporter [Nocardia sp. BMG51109]|uniref:MFS transporter n=1 Tax=Nocardia sp. BMG51109 TaxID=1056816 RepID=UPI0004BB90D8|nr:MFS transporter [Nocardia sp. BMG51109]
MTESNELQRNSIPTSTEGDDRRVAHAAATLPIVLVGVVLVAMSISGTAVALPDIADDLRASGSALNWVVAGYNLAFAVFTLVAGSLADIVGRRRVFTISVATFAVASLICAVGSHIAMVDAARFIAGVGAAGVMAAGGAILASTFQGGALTRAFALMGTMAGVGIAVGPSLSGALISLIGWRGSFGVYATIGIVLLVCSRMLRESRASGPHRVDWAGIALFVIGLSALMFAVLAGPDSGWSDPVVVWSVIGGLLALVAFAVVQLRVAAPVLDPGLVRNPGFMGWVLSTLTTVIGFLGALVYLPTFLQSVGGMSSGTAGLTMLLLTAPVLVLPSAAGAIVSAGGSARLLMATALILVVVGNLWLSVLDAQPTVVMLAGPLLCIGIGMGVSFGLTDGQAMLLVPSDRSGMAAGFLNTLRGSAEALVIAGFSANLLSLLTSRLGDAATAAKVGAGTVDPDKFAEQSQAFAWSWQHTQYVVAAICAVLGVVSIALIGVRRRPVGG